MGQMINVLTISNVQGGLPENQHVIFILGENIHLNYILRYFYENRLYMGMKFME